MDSKKAVVATPTFSPVQLGQNTQCSIDSDPTQTQTTTSHQVTPRTVLRKSRSHDIEYVNSDDSTATDSDCMVIETSSSTRPPRPPVTTSSSSAGVARRYTKKARKSPSPEITVVERKKIKVEKDEKKRSRCFFCRSKECHEDKYGAYCSIEARAYMKNRGATEEGLHDLFASYYTAALKLDLFRTFNGTVHHPVGLKQIPSCMMNQSYLKCVNEFRTDYC
jgi:hypothetical protein